MWGFFSLFANKVGGGFDCAKTLTRHRLVGTECDAHLMGSGDELRMKSAVWLAVGSLWHAKRSDTPLSSLSVRMHAAADAAADVFRTVVCR